MDMDPPHSYVLLPETRPWGQWAWVQGGGQPSGRAAPGVPCSAQCWPLTGVPAPESSGCAGSSSVVSELSWRL